MCSQAWPWTSKSPAYTSDCWDCRYKAAHFVCACIIFNLLFENSIHVYHVFWYTLLYSHLNSSWIPLPTSYPLHIYFLQLAESNWCCRYHTGMGPSNRELLTKHHTQRKLTLPKQPLPANHSSGRHEAWWATPLTWFMLCWQLHPGYGTC